ncbi:MAG: hypothetical protein V1716_04560 [Candidatus Uhrbacteria bacterium]
MSTSTFQIIRLSEGFFLVIAVSPHGADFKTPGRQYFFYDAEDSKSTGLVEVDEDRVTGYFSGQADGMGYEIAPDDVFPSLEAVFEWVAKKRVEKSRKYILANHQEEWAAIFLAEHREEVWVRDFLAEHYEAGWAERYLAEHTRWKRIRKWLAEHTAPEDEPLRTLLKKWLEENPEP